MNRQLICIQGHTWQVEPGLAPEAASLCPKCGAPGVPMALAETPVPVGDFKKASADRVEDWTRADLRDRGEPDTVHLPGYERLELIGRGGMGVVYKAWQTSLKRTVALKMILGGSFAGPAHLARFRTETEAVARFQHPNIVQIYEAGSAQGLDYCALEYADGGTLADFIGGQPQPASTAAALVETLARAMHYAHERGVVHRDLKPANVLLASKVEKPASRLRDPKTREPLATDTQPALGSGRFPLPVLKVTDFGLAKQLDSDAGQTQSGAIMGTPQYMAPEQARGALHEVGPRSDLYALGAILYEMLAGRPPFRGSSVGETLQQVLTQEPVAPSRWEAGIPRDLETICLKCLEKEPGRRYADCNALADDLRRFLDGQPILARPSGLVERSWKWAKRRPAAAALLGVCLAGVVLGLAVWCIVTVRLQKERDSARKEFDRAIRAVDEMLIEVAEEQLANEPRMQQKQRVLLEKALGFYQEFLREKSTDAEIRKKTALAHRRVADIQRKLGRRDESIAAYGEAIALLTVLIQDDPQPGYRQQLGECLTWLGEVQRTTNPPDAEEHFKAARNLQESLLAEFPGEPAYQRDIARSHYNLGIVYKDSGKSAEADTQFKIAIAMLDGLYRQNLGEPTYARELARCLLNHGQLQRARGEWDNARATLGRASELYRKLIADQPNAHEMRFELVVVCNSAGNAWSGEPASNLQQPEERLRNRVQAEHCHREALEACQILVKDFPSVPMYHNELANTYNSLAFVLVKENEKAAAEAWEKARKILTALLEQWPGVADYEGDLGMTLGNLGWLAARQDRWGDARVLLEEGIRRLQAALRPNPQQPTYTSSLKMQTQLLERGR